MKTLGTVVGFYFRLQRSDMFAAGKMMNMIKSLGAIHERVASTELLVKTTFLI